MQRNGESVGDHSPGGMTVRDYEWRRRGWRSMIKVGCNNGSYFGFNSLFSIYVDELRAVSKYISGTEN